MGLSVALGASVGLGLPNTVLQCCWRGLPVGVQLSQRECSPGLCGERSAKAEGMPGPGRQPLLPALISKGKASQHSTKNILAEETKEGARDIKCFHLLFAGQLLPCVIRQKP